MTDFTAALHLLRLNRFQRRQRRLKEKQTSLPAWQTQSLIIRLSLRRSRLGWVQDVKMRSNSTEVTDFIAQITLVLKHNFPKCNLDLIALHSLPMALGNCIICHTRFSNWLENLDIHLFIRRCSTDGTHTQCGTRACPHYGCREPLHCTEFTRQQSAPEPLFLFRDTFSPSLNLGRSPEPGRVVKAE